MMDSPGKRSVRLTETWCPSPYFNSLVSINVSVYFQFLDMNIRPKRVTHRYAAGTEHENTLEHFAQVSQVEGIMTLGWCRQKGVDNSGEDGHCSLG